MSAESILPPVFHGPLSSRLKALLAAADSATERNDRVLGVQCILQIFAEFDKSCAASAQCEPTMPNTAAA